MALFVALPRPATTCCAPARSPWKAPLCPSTLPVMRTNVNQSTINQRFTVPVAAEMLGISPEAVRARMHRGTLPKEKGDDGTVYVRLDADRTRPNGDGADDKTADQTPMVAVLREQVTYLREQLDREREARTEERRRQDTIIAQLAQANAALSARVPELPAADAQDVPTDARDGHETVAQGDGVAQDHDGDDGPQTDARRSWWRRLLDG